MQAAAAAAPSTTPPPTFSEPTARTAPDGAQEQELTITGSQQHYLQDWIQASSDAELCSYFRAITSGLAARQLEDYHFKMSNARHGPPWFNCSVFYSTQQHQQQQQEAEDTNDQRQQQQQEQQEQQEQQAPGRRAGPLQVSRCMSCDLECPLAMGVLGEQAAAAGGGEGGGGGSTAAGGASDQPQQQQREQQQPPQNPLQQLGSRDTLLKETGHCRVWLDAKARPVFVVTPQQHVERLADLTDAQLVDLFRAAPAILTEMGCMRWCVSAILNQGDARNHAHLHLKLRVHGREFEAAAARWPADVAAKLAAVRAFRDALPPEARGTHEAFLLRSQQAARDGRGGDDGGAFRRGRGRRGGR